MFKVWIVTLWIAYDGQLYMKYALPLQHKCNVFTWWSVKEQYEHTPLDIVAMKCTRVKGFRIDKRIFNYDKK